MKVLNKMFRIFLSPKLCPFCQGLIREEDTVCCDCAKLIESKILENTELDFSIDNLVLDKRYASYEYSGIIREGLLYAKLKSPRELLDFMTDRVIVDIINIIKINDIDMIVYSPYHKSKLHKQEYDLSQLMAKRISKNVFVPVEDVLVKDKKTKKQHLSTRNERKTNLIGAFRIIKSVRNRRILIIDDIITTGSTLNELAIILKSKGAKYVVSYSFAQTLNNN